MSDTSPPGSPDEAYRLSAAQKIALTYELRRYADSIAANYLNSADPLEHEGADILEAVQYRTESANTLALVRRYTDLAEVIERTGEIGPVALQSRELGEIADVAGWDDHSREVPDELREIADVARAAHRAAEVIDEMDWFMERDEIRRMDNESAYYAQLEDSLEQEPPVEGRSVFQEAEASTFGVGRDTPDANSALAPAAAPVIETETNGQEPIGAGHVVERDGVLPAEINSPECRDGVQSDLGPVDQGDEAVETLREELLTNLHEREADTVMRRDPAATAEAQEETAQARDVPLGQTTDEERTEPSESGPRSVLDRIRAKLHLDSKARAERLSAVGITLRPQETSTAVVHERAQAQRPRTYGLEGTAR